MNELNPTQIQTNPRHILTEPKCDSVAGTYAHARNPNDSHIVSLRFAASPARVDVQVPGAAAAASPFGRALHLVLGPPGTGKTTRLLDLLHAELERGTQADRIAFVSFTRTAREEACSRVRRDLRLAEDELPWFRTIHSAAYRLLGLTKAQVMGPAAWFTFALKHGYNLSSPTAESDDDPLAPPTRTGDDLLR